MLAALGIDSMEGLLVDIPQSLRIPKLELPNGLSEFETMAQVTSLAARNRVFPDRLTFRGGGVYRRFIPAAVAAVTSKPEFYTAYTPYQPEASQGTLQAIYEFQTLIAELTALEVANASLYDGATAVAEAAMMAYVHTGRKEVLVAGYVHPEYVDVLRAFSEGRGIKKGFRADRHDRRRDLSAAGFSGSVGRRARPDQAGARRRRARDCLRGSHQPRAPGSARPVRR
jgi:glycine dehydrogenase subunit 1